MPEPVRVLHMLPDLEVGGGQELLLRNIGALDPSHAMSFVCTVRPHGTMRARFARTGIPIIDLGMRQAADLPRAAARAIHAARRLGIDVVHTNNTGPDKLMGMIAALAAGRPVVNTIHSDFEPRPRGSAPKRALLGGRGAIEQALARRTVRHVLAVSARALQSWTPHLQRLGISPDHASVIRAGLDERAFSGEPLLAETKRVREALGLDQAWPVLINVARLVPGKGQRWLIETMQTVVQRWPRARLLLVGDGPDRAELAAMISARGLEGAVILLGARDDVPALLAAADLFVFASLSEGFGLAPLEAMAAGRPVIAFRLPALEEFIDDDPRTGSGILVPREDGAALTAAVLDLLAHPERMAAIGEAGHTIVRTRFSLDQTARELERVYLRLAGRDAPATLAIPTPEPDAAAVG